jgi:hypothetical protein
MRTSYRSWVYNIKVYLKLERCENLELSYLGKEKINGRVFSMVLTIMGHES